MALMHVIEINKLGRTLNSHSLFKIGNGAIRGELEREIFWKFQIALVFIILNRFSHFYAQFYLQALAGLWQH